MKVRELIDKLAKFDPELDVVSGTVVDDYIIPIRDVEITQCDENDNLDWDNGPKLKNMRTVVRIY